MLTVVTDVFPRHGVVQENAQVDLAVTMLDNRHALGDSDSSQFGPKMCNQKIVLQAAFGIHVLTFLII